jgi:glyoxylase-like metal-dependent hydrolase (beta-lactamase superfamily II)
MAGFERIEGRTWVLRGPANVGLFELEGARALLIDAANDDDGGRKLLKACDALGMSVAQIANTHSNADHCGGNAFIQARTGCGISATRIEAAFIETPLLEPSFLWGGFPPAPLRGKFLMAKPSRVTELLEAPCQVPGTGIQAVPLPGHFFGMVGFLTPDRVFFAADSVASAEILAKYHLFFYYDIAEQLRTLDALGQLEADWVVPSHAAPTRDIRPLAELNRAKILEIAAVLLEACATPATPEDLLAHLCARYGIDLNPAQYVLVGSTLRSYVAWLSDRQEVSLGFEAGRMRIHRTS